MNEPKNGRLKDLTQKGVEKGLLFSSTAVIAMTEKARNAVESIVKRSRVKGKGTRIRRIFQYIWPSEGDCSRFLLGIVDMRPEVLLPISRSMAKHLDLSSDPDLAMLLVALWLKNQYNKV